MSARYRASDTVMAAWALLLVILAADAAWAQDIAAVASAANETAAADAAAAVSAITDIGVAAAADVVAPAAVAADATAISNEITTQLAQFGSVPAASPASGGYVLIPDYYAQTCPSFYDILLRIAVPRILRDPGLFPGLLRLHFHDCFTTGCDASLLLDIAPEREGDDKYQVEKRSTKNERLRLPVFTLLDDIKAECERRCSLVVSAADILTATTWVALKMQPYYLLPGRLPPLYLGRKDAMTTYIDNANGLPGSTEDAEGVMDKFAAQGFSKKDVAVLIGVHTIGNIACEYVLERITSDAISTAPNKADLARYVNICKLKTGTGAPLTAMQARRLSWTNLKKLDIESGDEDAMTFADAITPNRFDSAYYASIRAGRSHLVVEIQMQESKDARTRAAMRAAPANWLQNFGKVWTKLSLLVPPSGTQLEVRPNCRCPSTVSREPLDECAFAREKTKY